MKTTNIFSPKLFLLISILFFGISIFFGNKIYQNLDKFQRYKLAYTSDLNFTSSLLDIKDYLISNEWKESNQDAEIKIKKSTKAYTTATFYSILSFLSILLYGSLFLFLYRIKKINSSLWGITILNISLVLLCIGIFVPFIELGAFMQDLKIEIGLGISKTFDGKMFFFYHCKSVVNLIQTLFENNNLVVGIAILFFSILFPFSKLIIFYYYTFTNNTQHKNRILQVISFVGKYSMADVFVAAIFLSFLSFNNMSVGVKTESSTLLGLYFFLGYCILSIAIYFVIEKKMKADRNQLVVSSLDKEY